MGKTEKPTKEELNGHWGKARESFRRWLVKYTKCSIQEGADGKGYPCGTCTMSLLTGLGLDSHSKEYQEHNKDEVRDRHNEVWRAILQIRDAKL